MSRPTAMTPDEKVRQLGRLCEQFWGIASDSSRMEAEELRALGDALYDHVWKQYADRDPENLPTLPIEDAIAREMGYAALAVFQEGVSPRRQGAYKRAARNVSTLLDRWLSGPRG